MSKNPVCISPGLAEWLKQYDNLPGKHEAEFKPQHLPNKQKTKQKTKHFFKA
jgi:hypothetical protein